MPLIERKHILRRVVPRDGCYSIYCDHIERYGEDLFRLACDRDRRQAEVRPVSRVRSHRNELGEDQEPVLLADDRA